MLHELLRDGNGLLFRFEDVQQARARSKSAATTAASSEPYALAPIDSLAQAYRAALGFETTVHLYVGQKEGSRALHPHTDPCEMQRELGHKFVTINVMSALIVTLKSNRCFFSLHFLSQRT